MSNQYSKRWICPSLCEESLIQKPIVKHKKIADGITITQNCCPICGKEMNYMITNESVSKRFTVASC